MKKIPITLIYLRVVLGILCLCFAIWPVRYSAGIIISFIAIGFVSDIFDGIIARRLNISTEKLRRLDSSIDQFFWLMILMSSYLLHPAFFSTNYIPILAVIGLEAFAYLLCYLKFGKEVATHAILSKIFSIILFIMLLQVIATGNSGIIFNICIYTGILTRCEIILILLILRSWTNDVPSLYHAILIRQGKPIKRNKWFNG